MHSVGLRCGNALIPEWPEDGNVWIQAWQRIVRCSGRMLCDYVGSVGPRVRPARRACQEVARSTGARKKSIGKSTPRPKAETESKLVADRIVLRDGKELFGQVDDSSAGTMWTILARRELVRKTLPNWATRWEDGEKVADEAAIDQRRERLAAWRRERPQEWSPGDQIAKIRSRAAV